MMRIMETTAQRLDALMNHRRLKLGMRWKGIAEKADTTYQTLSQLRKGKPVSDLTIANVEKALSWSPGSIRSILGGGDPVVLDPDAGADPLTASAVEWWDTELTGPSDLLHEDEVLRWRDEKGVREFEFRLEGITERIGAPPGTPPEEVVPKLRTELARTVARVSGLLPGRRQAATE